MNNTTNRLPRTAIRRHPARPVLLVLLALLLPARFAAAAELTTQSWPNTPEGFAAFTARLSERNPRNLAARPEAYVVGDGGRRIQELADGDAGARGAEGRVGIGGQPSIYAVYLGKAAPIHAVAFYTFNVDTRANQDYEVRFADNSGSPGKRPNFPADAALSTGDKVIGPDAGGFLSVFANPDGSPLIAKADWVEYRIWRTYNVKAGHPARSNKPESWTAGIELEVWGAPDDEIKPSPEVLARRAKLKEVPTAPPFIRRDTWDDTLLATREALSAWEKQLDDILMLEHGAEFAPWQLAGPYPADSAQAQLSAIPGDSPDWRPCPDLTDGQGRDLGQAWSLTPGATLFLRRSVVCSKNFNSDFPLSAHIAMQSGQARFAASGASCQGDRALTLQTWDMKGKKGSSELLVKLRADDAGRCPFYFQPQAMVNSRPSAGTRDQRIDRRRAVFNQVRREFSDPLSTLQLNGEEFDQIWLTYRDLHMAQTRWEPDEWAPGLEPLWLASRYRAMAGKRLAALADELAIAEPMIAIQARPAMDALAAELQNNDAPYAWPTDRDRYRQAIALAEMVAAARQIESMRLAVVDQIATFATDYPRGNDHLAAIAAHKERSMALWRQTIADKERALPTIVTFKQELDKLAQNVLLDNPLLRFEKLLVVSEGFYFASNWGGPNFLGKKFLTLSPPRPDGELTLLHDAGRITDYDIDFDAQKILYGNGRHIMEVGVDGQGLRQVTTVDDQHVKHFDGCYLPSGQLLFCSTACEQAVPCTGEWYVANLHLAEADGSGERRICFEQDHDWNPSVLNNGRVIYTRWEYTDTPHYFSRLLFHMNPDGTGQMEYYGSNSYWPNSMFWPRAIPGHPSAIVCVVTGHHGTGRQGELVLIDPARGRTDAQGVIQRIPGRGKQVDPVIVDGLVEKSWPRFAAPWPLAAADGAIGAGKYFLVNMRKDPNSPWGVYLVDVFDNLTPILMGNYMAPRPLLPRPRPPVISPRIDLSKDYGFVYMSDVTRGPGLRGTPAGVVKKLRIGAHHYRYGGNGDTYASSYEGGWDVKRIIGTVPVQEDGSAFFSVPANTPIFVQPLDSEGKALQTMRSWFVAMPGETLSCVGCHEPQNSVSPTNPGLAAKKPPTAFTLWEGPVRGFGFDQEVQPVLDRRCVGCHNGSEAGPAPATIDLRAKSLHQDFSGRYSPAYMAIHPYVRRAGYEADYAMQKPGEWAANTSPLVQMLKKGHHGVTLNPLEWERLYTWIDFNVPYAPNWRQSHQPPQDSQVERRAKYKKLHANIDDRDELILPAPPPAAPIAPALPKPAPAPLALPGWPWAEDDARARQAALAPRELVLDLAPGVTMRFVPIPAGTSVIGDHRGAPDEWTERAVSFAEPFWLGVCEVSNSQYACFDPHHDSAYMDARNKDRITRGYPVNKPDQPVVRISFADAQAFCAWLSDRSGQRCELPSEDEWEHACRAGTATPWPFGDAIPAGQHALANIADASLSRWGWGRCEKDYNDGTMFTAPIGKTTPNRWGLHDMIGNVAEWTNSTYAGDDSLRIVRGGSWNDRAMQARAASRWRYPRWQPVYNVGFRVKITMRQATTNQ